MNNEYIIGAIAGLILHEAGHVLACKIQGVKVKKVGISWRGAYVAHEPCAPYPHAMIAVAGPMVNILLVALLPFSMALPNLIIAVVNLLPLRGSDGSTLLKIFQKSA